MEQVVEIPDHLRAPGACTQPQVGGVTFENRSREKRRIPRGVEPVRIAIGEALELRRRDPAVLDELVRLGKDLPHVDDVPMAHVGTEHGIQRRPERLQAGVEGQRHHRIIRFTAEIERLGEQGRDVLCRLDLGRRPFVDEFIGLGHPDPQGVAKIEAVALRESPAELARTSWSAGPCPRPAGL